MSINEHFLDMRMSWNPKNIFSYFIKLQKKRSLKQIVRFHGEAAIRAIESQIHEAVEDGDLDKTKQHLADGIDPNSVLKPRGVTPLHIAAGRCDPKIVEVLLENNADVALRDFAGDTPLHYAIQGTFLPYGEGDEKRENTVVENMLAVVEMLASRGAKTNARNNCGQTPLNLVRFAEWNKAKKVLRKYGKTKGVDWRYSAKVFYEGPGILLLSLLGFLLVFFLLGLIIDLLKAVF